MIPYIQIDSETFISTYFLAISLGTIEALYWFLNRVPGRDEKTAIVISFIALISGFVGARLFHIFYENPHRYLQHPIEIVYVWNGGYVYYGGLISGLTASIIYLKRTRRSIRHWLDYASLPIGAGYAIGRIGCFLNGCCYGKISSLPWAMTFSSHAARHLPLISRHPTQLYAIFFELIGIAALYKLEQRKQFTRPGDLFFAWLIWHSIGRIVMEYFRDDDRGAPIFGMSVATIVSLLLILASVAVLIRSRSCKTTT